MFVGKLLIRRLWSVDFSTLYLHDGTKGTLKKFRSSIPHSYGSSSGVISVPKIWNLIIEGDVGINRATSSDISKPLHVVEIIQFSSNTRHEPLL